MDATVYTAGLGWGGGGGGDGSSIYITFITKAKISGWVLFGLVKTIQYVYIDYVHVFYSFSLKMHRNRF